MHGHHKIGNDLIGMVRNDRVFLFIKAPIFALIGDIAAKRLSLKETGLKPIVKFLVLLDG